MHDAVAPLKRTLDLNTRLFLNCLDGMSDRQAQERTSKATNHAAFLAVHLVDARHYLARALGLESESPYGDVLEEAKGIDDVKTFPPLDAVRGAWRQVSETLLAHLDTLDAGALSEKAPLAFPIEGGETMLGCLTFLTQHDTYHVGQLALLRKHVGLGAMSY